MSYEHTDPRSSTEITDRVTFCALSRLPADTATSHFFTVDDVFTYQPFFGDFGPLNINLAFKFCQMLNNKLAAPEYKSKKIYFFCFNRPQNKSNAAVLIGIWQIVYGGRTSTQAYEPLKQLEPYMPFRDASQGLCTFRLMPQHCLRAIAKGLKLNFFDFNDWNSALYEHFEQVENGDCNVIIPKKFLAFSGPHSTNVSPEGYPTLTPADYIPIFQMFGVKHVVRLNKKCYDRRDFVQANIGHYDLFFPDGTTPSNAILDKFLQISESVDGMIAVHCKAGLGRTGTLIGCYMLKHYHFSAAEAIAWMRLCRPGCVIGGQQHYLKLQEPRMWKLGKTISTGSSASSVASGMSDVSSAVTASVASSTSVNHPNPTPQYAISQPSSPNTSNPTSASATTGASYSASFDIPGSMNQQRIPSSSHASRASTATYQTRSATAAAAAAATSVQSPLTLTSPLHVLRGRSKLLRPTHHSPSSYASPSSANAHAEDVKDVSAPLSAPQPFRHTSGNGKLSTSRADASALSNSGGSISVQRTLLFDSKSWITNSGARRSPSANGLRRGNTLSPTFSPTQPLHPNSNLNNSFTAASIYTQPITAKSKPRSASVNPTLSFRQTKSRAGNRV